MFAIPCILYVNDDDLDKVKKIFVKLDEEPASIQVEGVEASLYPDLSQSIQEHELGSIPEGQARYEAEIKFAQEKPRKIVVMARNAMEAATRAFSEYQKTMPSPVPEDAEVDVQVTRIPNIGAN